MPPLNALDTWSVRNESKNRQPKSKCFIIGEGAHTEYKYLKALSLRLAKQGIPKLIEIKPVRRSGLERNHSAPQRLRDQAISIREDKDNEFDFEKGSDQVVVIFDADIFKGKAEQLDAILASFEGIAIPALTNPCFELFLLLHKENAVQDIILPNAEALFENGAFEGKRRFADKLVSDTFGINPKSGHVDKLSERFELAAEAEKALNQDLSHASEILTSNVGFVLSGIIYERGTLS